MKDANCFESWEYSMIDCMNNIKTTCMHDDYALTLLWKYFYLLAPIFMVS
jgi:hypothetical protein